MVTLTTEEFKEYQEYYYGYCELCNDIYEDSGLEGDAENCYCNVCGKNTLMGIENALISGLIEIIEENDDE